MGFEQGPIAPTMPPWTVRLPEGAAAPRVACEALDEWMLDVDPRVRRDARSVVSELVANAVREGSAPIELSVTVRSGRARVEITDAGAREGRRPPDGWAQRILQELATCWGVRGDEAHVWFELALPDPAPAQPRRPAGT